MADNREDPLLKVPGDRQLFLVVLLLSFPSPAPLMNVHAAADEAGKRTGVVAKRDTAIEDPAVHTVLAPQAVFHLERFAALEVVEVVRRAAIEVLGVNSLGPAIAHLLGERDL
jgi:hypothetical protein